MDTPILTGEPPPEPDGGGRPGTHVANAIGILASLIALAGSIYGFAQHTHHAHRAPATNTPADAIFGDPVSPAALTRGTRNAAPGREVCSDEFRWNPASGAWRCAEWQVLNASQIGRVAYYAGDPCTHRKILVDETEWTCVTTIPVPAAARTASPTHPVEFGDPLPGRRLCRAESRATRGGPWHCVDSFAADSTARTVKPVEPRPGCRVYRAADELTGIWECDDG